MLHVRRYWPGPEVERTGPASASGARKPGGMGRSGNVSVGARLHGRGMSDLWDCVRRWHSAVVSTRRRGGRSGNVLDGDKSHGGGGIESPRNWVRVALTVRLSIETTVISILVAMAGPLGPVGGCLARDRVTVSGSSLTVVSSAFPRIRR